MAKATASLLRDNSNVANFKAWAKQIDDWLQLAGWTPYAVTGQLGGNANWAAVAAVPASNVRWYLIYQSPSDGHTGFFLRYEFGNQTGANSPYLRFQFGSSSDPSGNLTNASTVIGVPGGAGTVSAVTTYDCYFCYNGANFWLGMWTNNASDSAFLFILERAKDTSGNVTSDHVTLISHIYSGITPMVLQQSLNLTGGAFLFSSKNGVCAINFGTGTTTQGAAKIALSPIYPMVGVYDAPLISALVGKSTDFSDTQEVDVISYGVSHHYVFLNKAARPVVNAISGLIYTNGLPADSGTALGLIWE